MIKHIFHVRFLLIQKNYMYWDRECIFFFFFANGKMAAKTQSALTDRKSAVNAKFYPVDAPMNRLPSKVNRLSCEQSPALWALTGRWMTQSRAIVPTLTLIFAKLAVPILMVENRLVPDLDYFSFPHIFFLELPGW